MHHSVFTEAWLLWLRPLTAPMQVRGLPAWRCLPPPWDLLLKRWMECVLPRAEISRADAVRGWMEEWWSLTAVVPRSLYLEVLERKEVLRARLEEAEATIQQLRVAKEHERRDHEMVNTWEAAIHLWQRAVHTTGKAQSEWIQTWTDFALNNRQRG